MIKKKKPGRPRKSKAVQAKKTKGVQAEKKVITPHPTAKPKVLDFEKKLDEILEDPQAAKAAESPAPGPSIKEGPDLSIRILADSIKIPFELWSLQIKADEKLRAALCLSGDEADLLAVPVSKLLAYYAPQIPEIASAWFALAITTWSVMSTRLHLLADYRKKNKTPPKPGPGPVDAHAPRKHGQVPDVNNFPNQMETTQV